MFFILQETQRLLSEPGYCFSSYFYLFSISIFLYLYNLKLFNFVLFFLFYLLIRFQKKKSSKFPLDIPNYIPLLMSNIQVLPLFAITFQNAYQKLLHVSRYTILNLRNIRTNQPWSLKIPTKQQTPKKILLVLNLPKKKRKYVELYRREYQLFLEIASSLRCSPMFSSNEIENRN